MVLGDSEIKFMGLMVQQQQSKKLKCLSFTPLFTPLTIRSRAGLGQGDNKVLTWI